MLVPESIPRENPPEGAHIARCFQLIDFGTQKTSYKGVAKEQHQIQLGWELPNELMKDGRPFGAFKLYNWFMSERANLRKDLESWQGRKFTETDLRGPKRFNLKHCLGKTCVLTILYKTSDDGERIYPNVDTLSPLPKGMGDAPPAINKPVYLGLAQEYWDVRVFESLPEWMQNKIKESPEYQDLTGGNRRVSRQTPANGDDFPGDRPPSQDWEEDLPEMR